MMQDTYIFLNIIKTVTSQSSQIALSLCVPFNGSTMHIKRVFVHCPLHCFYIKEAVLNRFYLEMLSQRRSNNHIMIASCTDTERSAFSDLFLSKHKFAF